MAELFGQYHIGSDAKEREISIAGSKIRLQVALSSIRYARTNDAGLETHATIMSDKEQTQIGIYPVPPIFTPKPVAKNLYLKFRFPVIVDQRGEVVVYAKMPIEIGVYRQLEDEELLIDSFSPSPQKYALYGSPESGVVCRYADTDALGSAEEVSPEKYQHALVRIRILNDIDNIVKVSKVIIPMDGIILDHAHDDAWLPGTVEMALDSVLGRDIVNVRHVEAKIKRPDKTSLVKREETRTFRMDAGY